MSAEAIQPDNLPVSNYAKSDIGRPLEYTDDQREQILDRVRLGYTLKRVCSELNIPHDTVQSWRTRNPAFAQSLAQARVVSADALVDEAMDIIDDPETGMSHESISWAKLRSEYRRWLASKYKPQAYGDKLDVSGDLTLTTVIRRFSGTTIEQDAQVIDVVEESTPKA